MNRFLYSLQIILLVLLSYSSVKGITSSREQNSLRISILEHHAKSIDADSVTHAIQELKMSLSRCGDCVGLWYLLYELSREACFSSKAYDFSMELSHENSAVNFYLNGELELNTRDFQNAAKMFERSYVLSLSQGDTLSGVFSVFRSIQCFLQSHDIESAGEGINRAKELERHLNIKFVSAVFTLLFAQYLNMLDSLTSAEEGYRSLLNDPELKNYATILLGAYEGLGRLNEKRFRLEEACSYYGSAIEIADRLGAKRSLSIALNNLGQVEIKRGNVEEGRIHLNRAMSLADECNERWLYGYIYYGMGSSYEMERKYSVAFNYFQKSVEFHRLSRNLWGELGSRLRVAYLYVLNDEYEKARKEYNYCIENYTKMKSLYGLSWAIGGRAICNHRLGFFNEAERDYKKCLELRRKIQDFSGCAWALASLGMLYDITAQNSKAILVYTEAIKIAKSVRNLREEGRAYFGLASAYYYLGRNRRAVNYYLRALEIAESLGDVELQYMVSSGLGSVYLEEGKYDEAEKFYINCYDISVALKSTLNIIWSCNNLASLYMARKDFPRAKAYLKMARAYEGLGGYNYLKASTAYLEATLEQQSVRRLKKLLKTIKVAKKAHSPGILWRALSDAAHIEFSRGNRARAIELQTEAIEVVEGISSGTRSIDIKENLMESCNVPYRRLVYYLLSDDRDHVSILKALETAERSRSISFEVLLGNLREMSGDSLTIRKRNRTLSRLSFLQRKLQSPSIIDIERIKIISEIGELERELEVVEMQASQARGLSEVGNIDWEKLLGTIGEDEAIASFFLGSVESYLFLITADSIDVFRVPPEDSLKKLIDRYLSVLSSMTDISCMPEEVFNRCSREVFSKVFGCAYKRFREKRKLVIIADGILHNLPFATLISPDGLIIREHAISYCPSLRTLIFLKDRARDRAKNRGQFSFELVAFGCKGIGGESAFDKHGRLFAFTTVPVLPLYQAEAEAILVGKSLRNSVVSTGRMATERSFKSFPLDRTWLLHIAAHCYVDNEDVRRSFIVFNETKGEGEMQRARECRMSEPWVEDGIVQWNEILALDLQASLVAISGCRSAQGVVSSGEGVRGLSQAFIYSGANCVLASMLDVPDRETSRFMEYFYKEVSKGISFDESLRLAQLKAMKTEGVLSSPSVWGAFSLIGSADARAGAIEETSAQTRSGAVQIVAIFLSFLIVVIVVVRSLR